MGAPKTAVLSLLVFVGLFFVARIPSYHRVLDYEEGVFAELFVERPEGPAYGLLARIDGVKVYNPLSHPAGLYEVIRVAGYFGSTWLPDPPLPDEVVTPRLRRMFSAFQLVFFGLLGVFAYRSLRGPARAMALFVIVVAAISPLSIYSSTMLQVDGSSGVLLCGALTLVLASCASARRVGAGRWALLALGAVLLGMGKQEWSLALVAAMVAWWVCLLVRRRCGRREMGVGAGLTVVLLVGLVSGHALIRAYDPANYAGGWSVFARFSRTAMESETLPSWFEATLIRGRMILVFVGLFAAIAILAGSDRKRVGPFNLLLFLFGSALFGGYFVSRWGPHDARYFAPALIVLVTSVVGLCHGAVGRRGRVALALIFAPLLVHSGDNIYRTRRLVGSRPEVTAPLVDSRYVQKVSTGEAWNRDDLDFVSNALGDEGAAREANRLGKILWSAK